MELSNTPKVCKGLLYALYLGLELFSWICVSLFHTRLEHICRIKSLGLLFHFGLLWFRSNLSHRDSNQDLQDWCKEFPLCKNRKIIFYVFYTVFMNSICMSIFIGAKVGVNSASARRGFSDFTPLLTVESRKKLGRCIIF